MLNIIRCKTKSQPTPVKTLTLLINQCHIFFIIYETLQSMSKLNSELIAWTKLGFYYYPPRIRCLGPQHFSVKEHIPPANLYQPLYWNRLKLHYMLLFVINRFPQLYLNIPNFKKALSQIEREKYEGIKCWIKVWTTKPVNSSAPMSSKDERLRSLCWRLITRYRDNP